uniref:Uncharacterized protein n=1 Tax=Rhizophora mucronata TaxID=61149 RepID=A0A2P2KWA8_RHIMU
MYPSCLILCKKSLPKRPSIPLSKLKRPEIFTTIGTSLYLEAYKSPTFPPARNPFIILELQKTNPRSSYFKYFSGL